MTQLTIFDINKKEISEDEINNGKWEMFLKIDKAHNNNKISTDEYFTLKERVEIHLNYSKEGNLESDDNE